MVDTTHLSPRVIMMLPFPLLQKLINATLVHGKRSGNYDVSPFKNRLYFTGPENKRNNNLQLKRGKKKQKGQLVLCLTI